MLSYKIILISAITHVLKPTFNKHVPNDLPTCLPTYYLPANVRT